MQMGKKGKEKIPQERENLEQGIRLFQLHRLFGKLKGYIRTCKKKEIGKDCISVVKSDGTIWVNEEYLLHPKEWLYILALQHLHLAFGHFDEERMPGKNTLPQHRIDIQRWNLACDLYCMKFLNDMKCGQNPFQEMDLKIKLTDEADIYNELQEKQWREEETEYFKEIRKRIQMIGLDKPLVYQKGQKNRYVEGFSYALAYSVTETIDSAAGTNKTVEKCSEKVKKAAEWFMNHYPLLGGVATGFQIIEDYRICTEEEIQIAAVDIEAGEIYINPAVGLDEEELKFVLAHEYLHAGLQHHIRSTGKNAYLWNVACDYVINGWLVELKIGKMPECALYDMKFTNMSAEMIYDEILSDIRQYMKLGTFRGYGKGEFGRIKAGKNVLADIELDQYFKEALSQGLEYHQQNDRGYLPAGLIEEIKALSMPAIPWDVELAQWFEIYFPALEKHRTYARPSRRQGTTPDIPRPRMVWYEEEKNARTFGVIVDTSGSMDKQLIGKALGSIASYANAKDVPFVRVVFCDAKAYDAGYMEPERIADRVEVIGRGGTILQYGVDCLENAKDFPKDGPILIITDGFIESNLKVHREHAYLIPRGHRLPFKTRGKIFYFQ